MVCPREDVDYVQIKLVPPFKSELKSALTGPRLIRSALEMIAGDCVESFDDIESFL